MKEHQIQYALLIVTYMHDYLNSVGRAIPMYTRKDKIRMFSHRSVKASGRHLSTRMRRLSIVQTAPRQSDGTHIVKE